MTNEFDTKDLQEHVRKQSLTLHRIDAAKLAAVFFAGVAFGFGLAILFCIIN